MDFLEINPNSIDSVRDYTTNLVVNKGEPNIRHVSIDVACSLWELSYHLSVVCSHESTHTLSIADSATQRNDWDQLSTVLVKLLVARIPNITTLVLKPVDIVFQSSLLGAYCEKLVELTLHFSSAVNVSWTTMTFRALENVSLIQDRAPLTNEESLPLLFSNFVFAPRLCQAALVGVTQLRYTGVHEFLLAFRGTLEKVKLLGTFVFHANAGVLPVLPLVTDLHLEFVVAEKMLSAENDAVVRLPNIRRIVFESGWQFLEVGTPGIHWEKLKKCLMQLSLVEPRPSLSCGYRGVAEARGDFYIRTFVDAMFEATVGWNVLDVFEVEQVLCSVLPAPTMPITSIRKRKLTQFDDDLGV